jgi:hypothetical protein
MKKDGLGLDHFGRGTRIQTTTILNWEPTHEGHHGIPISNVIGINSAGVWHSKTNLRG